MLSRPQRLQRWFCWLLAAGIALQIYVVREWLAALLLLGVLFVGMVILAAVGWILNSAWSALRRSAAALWDVARSTLAVAKTVARTVFTKTLAGSNS
jgi:ABC-type uncharacterized transport system YnjBCD permease subunit